MNQNVSMYFDLIASVKTVKEADSLSMEIGVLEEALFKSEKTSFDQAMDMIGVSTGKKITGIVKRLDLDTNDKEAVLPFLQSIKDLIKKFKVIKLILAFDPPPKAIENIHAFVKNTIGTGYVMDIEVSEKIMAGAIIIFNGKYNDYSLRKTLEEAFKNKKEEILEFMQ